MTNGQSAVKTPARPRVVVLGAGFAGLNAALRLAHYPVDVTLVDRQGRELPLPTYFDEAGTPVPLPSNGCFIERAKYNDLGRKIEQTC